MDIFRKRIVEEYLRHRAKSGRKKALALVLPKYEITEMTIRNWKKKFRL